jgi:hypothetical protein
MTTAGILQTQSVTQGHGIGPSVYAHQTLFLLQITPSAFQVRLL